MNKNEFLTVSKWIADGECEVVNPADLWHECRSVDIGFKFEYYRQTPKDQPDPNAKQKEAFKEGKKIYAKRKVGCSEWIRVSYPSWTDLYEFRIEHWSDRFKEATKAGKIVEWRHKTMGWITPDDFEMGAWGYDGNESDYRIVEPEKVDQFAELKAAFKMGKTVFYRGKILGNPEWDGDIKDYEIKEPKLSPSEIQSLITALNDSKLGDKVEDVVMKWSGNL